MIKLVDPWISGSFAGEVNQEEIIVSICITDKHAVGMSWEIGILIAAINIEVAWLIHPYPNILIIGILESHSFRPSHIKEELTNWLWDEKAIDCHLSSNCLR